MGCLTFSLFSCVVSYLVALILLSLLVCLLWSVAILVCCFLSLVLSLFSCCVQLQVSIYSTISSIVGLYLPVVLLVSCHISSVHLPAIAFLSLYTAGCSSSSCCCLTCLVGWHGIDKNSMQHSIVLFSFTFPCTLPVQRIIFKAAAVVIVSSCLVGSVTGIDKKTTMSQEWFHQWYTNIDVCSFISPYNLYMNTSHQMSEQQILIQEAAQLLLLLLLFHIIVVLVVRSRKHTHCWQRRWHTLFTCM